MSLRPLPNRAFPLIAAFLLLLAGCAEERAHGRVLVVGIDGASMRVVLPMMKARRLPNLAAIAKDGVSGTMASLIPMKSPRLWTTIATGKLPENHGVLHFTSENPSGEERLVASHDRVGHALWNMATTAGLTVGVVNWWVTYPPEKVNGVVVSDHFMPSVVKGREDYFDATTEDVAPIAYPLEWQARVRDLLSERRKSRVLPFTDLKLPGWVSGEILGEYYLDDGDVGAVAVEVEQATHPDLMMLMMKGVDPVSHVLWGTVETTPDRIERMPANERERADGAETVRRFYAQTDRVLGELLEAYGPDDLVMVVSDHGFENSKRVTGLTGIHNSPMARRAIFFARGPGIEPGSTIETARVQDVTPTILTWLGLPVGEDMDGQPLDLIQRTPVAPIATWDTTPVERVATRSAGAEAEIMQQLEALGYFESEELEESEVSGDSEGLDRSASDDGASE